MPLRAARMSRVALDFDRVRKSFGSHVALADFTLQVREGELFGLAGVNGAGKTTLLKCLLDFAATGRRYDPHFRRLSPQNRSARNARLPARALSPALLPHRTGFLAVHAAPACGAILVRGGPGDVRCTGPRSAGVALARAVILEGNDAETRARRMHALGQAASCPRRADERPGSQGAGPAQGAAAGAALPRGARCS